ncbi:MAG TPA: tol-pal system protein YbgF [Casimicrobiaceae bacterium]|jgi:tol-pal system protein YbgF
MTTDRSIHPRVLAAVLAFAAFAQSANAAFFEDDEARKRIESTNQRLSAVQKSLEDRISALEQQLKAQGLVDLFNQSEQMRNDLAKLRGQIEVLTYELEQAQKRQKDLYVDLDTRLRKIESGVAASTSQAPADGMGNASPAAGAPGNAPNVAVPPTAGTMAPVVGAPSRAVDAVAEQRAYDAALDQFKRGDYNGAINSFNAFVKTYPTSPLASSAQYWVGNAQYARRDYKSAIATQRQLLQAYPNSTKAPEALLNIASAQSDLNDNASARRTLEELIRTYPQSEAATKARQRLGQR